MICRIFISLLDVDRTITAMYARAPMAPSCSGFTIGQICGIMSACPNSRPPEEDHLRRDARRWRPRAVDLLLGPSLQPLDDHERGPMAGR